jgi:hypothetical protein
MQTAGMNLSMFVYVTAMLIVVIALYMLFELLSQKKFENIGI